MSFTSDEIKNIELVYRISLPASYKKILLVIGDKLLDTKPSFLAPDLSIYTLQEQAKKMMDATKEDGITLSDQLRNAFFIMKLSDDILVKYYFIHPLGQKDCPVYCWEIDDNSDLDLVREVSSSIDCWLCKTNFLLYIEAKIKGVFQSAKN